MSKAEQKRMIAEYWSRLSSMRHESAAESSRCFDDELYRLKRIVMEEERRHRRYTSGYGVSNGLSAPLAVKLFILQRVLQCRTGEIKRPKIELILSWQPSIFYCFAIWKEFEPSIRRTFSVSDSKAFLDNVDYVELMQ